MDVVYDALGWAYLAAQIPFVKGALGGALTAALIDIQAFRSWNTWKDVASYNWTTASFRWVQGGVVGALTVAGLSLA